MKDKREDKTREGAGRVAIYNHCREEIFSYTLECNYIRGSRVNLVKKKRNLETGQDLEDKGDVERLDSFRYQTGPPYFVPEVLWDIGKNCAVSLLDLVEKNKISRIVPAGYKSLALLHLELVNNLETLEEIKREKKLKRVKSSIGDKKVKKKIVKKAGGKKGGKKNKEEEEILIEEF